MERIAEKELKEKLGTLMGMYSGAFQEIAESRRYYDRDFGSDIVPPQWMDRLTPLIPETARRAIDDAADHILTFPVIKVPARPTENDQVGEEVRAEVVRQACTAWWGHIEREFNIIGDGRKPLLNEGRIVVRKTLRWDLIPDYPSKKGRSAAQFQKALSKYRADLDRLGRSEFLWNVELLDNVTVYDDPSNYRDPNYRYIQYRTFVEDAKRRWPKAAGKWRNQSAYEQVTYTEYWSKPGPVGMNKEWEPGQFIQWIEDEPVHDADNPYPYIPLVSDDPGFGLNHHLAKPEQVFVGMTQHFRSIFRAQAESMTSWLAVERLAAFPIGIGRNLPDAKVINIGPGEIINMEGAENDPNREDLTWMSHPDVPQGVVALDARLDRSANSTFKMDVLGGMPQKGVDTATEADLNIRNAVSKLSGPINALERVVAKLTKQMLMDVELVLRAPVTLYGTNKSNSTPAEIALKPTDINGFYEVHASLTTSDQEAMNQSTARFWLEAAERSRGLSIQTAYERGGIVDDPIIEITRRLSENTLFSAAFEVMRNQAAAQDLGIEIQEARTNDSGQGDEASLLGPRADSAINPSAPSNVSPTQQNVTEQAYRNRDTANVFV